MTSNLLLTYLLTYCSPFTAVRLHLCLLLRCAALEKLGRIGEAAGGQRARNAESRAVLPRALVDDARRNDTGRTGL